MQYTLSASQRIPKDQLLLNRFQVLLRQKLLLCGIEKNAITTFTQWTAGLSNIPWKWFQHSPMSSLNNNYFRGKPQHVLKLLDSLDWTKVVALREPHERFLSGFLSKCVNPREDEDRSCPHFHGKNVTFSEFVDAVYKYGHKLNAHFMPQADFCGDLGAQISKYDFVFLITQNSKIMFDQISMICSRLDPNFRDDCFRVTYRLFPIRKLLNSHTRLASSKLKTFYNKDLWDKVSDMFKRDFQLAEYLTVKELAKEFNHSFEQVVA